MKMGMCSMGFGRNLEEPESVIAMGTGGASPVMETDPVDVQVLPIGAFKPVEQLLSRDVDSLPR
jgi:hypothetical protein